MKVHVIFYDMSFKIKGHKQVLRWSAYGPTEEAAKKRAIRRIKEEFDLFVKDDSDIEIHELIPYHQMEIDGYDP